MKIRKIDGEIREVVRNQTDAGELGKAELEEAKRVITELFTRVELIKSKAEQSEQMVHEITADIKQLDYAKRNLTASITALKRMNMLVSAVEQLKVMSQRRQYREAASILQAVQQLISYFKAYRQIRKVQEYADTVAIIQAQLGKQVKEEFEKRCASLSNTVSLSKLALILYYSLLSFFSSGAAQFLSSGRPHRLGCGPPRRLPGGRRARL